MTFRPDRRRLCLYGLIPAGVGASLIAAYFSGIPALQALAAPARQREYGLVENLQNALLLAMIVLAVWSARRERAPAARLAWCGLACFAGLVLMEEIDWGDHYYASLTGRRLNPEGNFNLHNQGDVVQWTKLVVDAGYAVFFVVLPALRRWLPRAVRPWIASPYSALTLLVALGSRSLAHHLHRSGWQSNGGLTGNISEFREVFTYWVAWLYLTEIAARRLGRAWPLTGRAGSGLRG